MLYPKNVAKYPFGICYVFFMLAVEVKKNFLICQLFPIFVKIVSSFGKKIPILETHWVFPLLIFKKYVRCFKG
ncbi:MAG: hypothetical protein RL757_2886 [Bacteroidota bacterium]|jgi:hypothetical protein